MGYAQSVADRRAILGRRIKRARLRAGYKSQKAFALAIGVDTTSIAWAEVGNKRVAVRGKVFGAIEDGLGWAEDSIAHYLETGDQSLLAAATIPEPERPLTELERLTYLIYLELRVQKIDHVEARRIAVDIGRLLGQDETVLTTAIERESHPAM